MEQYIILKGIAGLGNRLSALSAAIKYAQTTNRKLIVEWNDHWYSSHSSKNVFFEFFQLVNIDSSLQHTYDIPHYSQKTVAPAMWFNHLTDSSDQVMQFPLVWKLNDQYLGQKCVVELDRSYTEDIVIFTSYGGLDRKILRHHLKLKPAVQKIVCEFAEKYFSETVIGVHVRFTDKQPKQPLKTVFQKIDDLLSVEPTAKIFLATDNPDIIIEFKLRYVNHMLVRNKWFPSEHTPIHRYQSGRIPEEILLDAVVEMFLLSHCKYLIAQGNSSFSRISTCYFKSDSNNIMLW
ncbi:nodulation protein NodZ [Microcoleus sp. D2_18a_D3]|uniref:nodulation protein NodZ n=1 Tax=Microcoleus sp. D2_18a_D3 TaxID=3055330 RepID=UPI002FD76B9D